MLTPICLCAQAQDAAAQTQTDDANPGEETPELDLAIWDYSVNLRGAFGYKNNVLLSAVDRQGSTFWQTALDAMLLRADLETAGNLTLFLTLEDRRYFSDIEVEKEQLALFQTKYEQPIGDDWFWSATAQYLYVDQVFDASATEQVLETLPVKSHNYQLSPAIGRNLPWNSKLELKLVPERQHFNQPLDDYWEFGPQLTWTKLYGHKSELTAAYTFDHRLYDTRGQMDFEGSNGIMEIEDTSLRYQQHELELGVNHSWGEDRKWRSRARFLFEINDDNGTGYYDFKRYRLSKRFGYYGADWQATIEGRILHYDYDVQPVEGTDEIRSTWEYVIAGHAEKRIWRKLSIFADFEYENVDSNYALEVYDVTTVFGGVDWEF
ncbi:MAG TPA: hypothetical protein VF773_23035 [Verrucomicrobiae bacterium]